jgi:hypothetical protein
MPATLTLTKEIPGQFFTNYGKLSQYQMLNMTNLRSASDYLLQYFESLLFIPRFLEVVSEPDSADCPQSFIRYHRRKDLLEVGLKMINFEDLFQIKKLIVNQLQRFGGQQ